MHKNRGRALMAILSLNLLCASAQWRGFLRYALMPRLSGVSALVRFPIAGALVALIIGALIPRGRLKRLARLSCITVWLLIAIWLPLYTDMPYPVCADATPAELKELAYALARRANELAPASAIDIHTVPALAEGAMESRFARDCEAPKYARYPEFMRVAGIAGIYIPFTGEAILNPGEPAFSMPFIACHELAHQLGLANEGQANLAAFIACASSKQPSFQYAGYVEALKYALLALGTDAQSVLSELRPSVARDLRAITGDGDHGAGALTRITGDYADITYGLVAIMRDGRVNPPSDPTA